MSLAKYEGITSLVDDVIKKKLLKHPDGRITYEDGTPFTRDSFIQDAFDNGYRGDYLALLVVSIFGKDATE